MTPDLTRAQAQFDSQQAPGCFISSTNTPSESLQFILERAARNQKAIDDVEVGLSEPNDGEHVVTFSFWPVTYETRKQLADAMVEMATQILNT